MEDTPAKHPNTQHSGSDRKFWKICLSILRWVLVLFFGLRLVFGIYVGASWKVLMLYAVPLALLTVVPRPWRKYGWGVVVLVLIGAAAWIFLPESDSANWHPFVYDVEIQAINEKYGVPDDENAAVYYAQIKPTDFYEDQTPEERFSLKREKRGPDKWDPNDTTLHRPWTAEEFPEMAAWLETEQEKIAPLWQAVQHERCWFPITFGPNYMPKKLEHITPMRKAADTILRSIYLDLGNNDISSAVVKCTALLQCARHLQQQSPLLNQLLGMIIYQRTSKCIRRMVVHCPVDDSALDALEESINHYEIDWEDFINRFIEFEKATYKHSAGLVFEFNQRGQTRINLKLLNELDRENLVGRNLLELFDGEKPKEPSVFWQTRKRKYIRLCEWLSKPISPQDFFDTADLAYRQFHERLLDGNFEVNLPEHWWETFKYGNDPERISLLTLEIQIPKLEQRHRDFQRLKTRKKGTLIMLDLRRYYNAHGQWPQRLAEIEAELPEGILSNPELGWEFMYYQPGNYDSFVLYSYGGDDDSYQQTRDRPWRFAEVGLDDILIWPEKTEPVPGAE